MVSFGCLLKDATTKAFSEANTCWVFKGLTFASEAEHSRLAVSTPELVCDGGNTLSCTRSRPHDVPQASAASSHSHPPPLLSPPPPLPSPSPLFSRCESFCGARWSLKALLHLVSGPAVRPGGQEFGCNLTLSADRRPSGCNYFPLVFFTFSSCDCQLRLSLPHSLLPTTGPLPCPLLPPDAPSPDLFSGCTSKRPFTLFSLLLLAEDQLYQGLLCCLQSPGRHSSFQKEQKKGVVCMCVRACVCTCAFFWCPASWLPYFLAASPHILAVSSLV